MATLKVVLYKAKALKDGTHKLRIAISHKGVTSYIVTRFIVEEKEFKNGMVVKRNDASVINAKLRHLLDVYQERLDGIEHQSLYTAHQLRLMLTGETTEQEEVTFEKLSKKYESELIDEGRINYSKLLARSRVLFTQFCRGDIPLQGVTEGVINNYIKWLRKIDTLSETSVNMMLSRLKVIVNLGIKRNLVKYDTYPFLNIKIGVAPSRECDIPVLSMQKIMLAKLTQKKYRVARDLFMLSVYTGGANLADLMSIDFSGNEISYIRTKSKGRMRIETKVELSIQPEAKEIIDRWKGRNGKLDFGYLLSYDNFSRYVLRSLQSIAEMVGIKDKVIFYTARKSFSQYASELGIHDGVIDYCLGHSDKSKGIISFYKKARRKQGDFAVSKVIDYIKDPDKYKDVIEMTQSILLMKD